MEKFNLDPKLASLLATLICIHRPLTLARLFRTASSVACPHKTSRFSFLTIIYDSRCTTSAEAIWVRRVSMIQSNGRLRSLDLHIILKYTSSKPPARVATGRYAQTFSIFPPIKRPEWKFFSFAAWGRV